MAYTLPIDTTTEHFSFLTELDGETYGFEFHWNERESGWFMSVLTADEEPIVAGKRVVVDWPLTARDPDVRLPPGMLVAQDTEGARQDPGRYDLGSRVVLLYFTADEVG
jgi:hypothetical protein